jgi:hypothetical protein
MAVARRIRAQRTALGGVLAGVALLNSCPKPSVEALPLTPVKVEAPMLPSIEAPILLPIPSPSPRSKFLAAYYQPRRSDLYDPKSLQVPQGVYTMVAEVGKSRSWNDGDCRLANVAAFLEQPNTRDVRVVGGFSLGRYGLAGLLQNREAVQNIDYMIAFDPANQVDFSNSCDPADTATLLKDWLRQSKKHHFTVIAGQLTAENNFAGIREHYFSDIVGTDSARQATVCSTNLGHEATFNTYKDVLVQPPITRPSLCPEGTTGWQPKS